MKHRVLDAAAARVVLHLLLVGRPFVAEEDGNGPVPRVLAQRAHVQDERALGLGVAVLQAHLRDDVVHGLGQQPLAGCRHLHFVAFQRGSAFAKSAVPLGAGGGLDAVFVAHLEQGALPRHVFQRVLYALAEEAGVGRDVVDQQVGQRARVGLDAEVPGALSGQLADQEGDAAQIAAERALARVVVQLGYARVDLVEQHAGVDQVGRQGGEEVAGGDDGSGVALGDSLQRVVKDAQLRPKLAVLARDGLEALLPEPAASP